VVDVGSCSARKSAGDSGHSECGNSNCNECGDSGRGKSNGSDHAAESDDSTTLSNPVGTTWFPVLPARRQVGFTAAGTYINQREVVTYGLYLADFVQRTHARVYPRMLESEP